MKKKPPHLTAILQSGKTLAQKLEDARMLLSIHGYIADRESDRIRVRLQREWDRERGEASPCSHCEGEQMDGLQCEYCGRVHQWPKGSGAMMDLEQKARELVGAVVREREVILGGYAGSGY